MMTASTATQTGSASQMTRPARRRELDVLGMAIVLGLIFFHTLSIFSGQQYIVNTSQSMVTTMVSLLVVSFAALWTMPLMMLIAGIAISYSLRRRTPGEFLRERVKRLFVPFLTGLVLLVPPMMFYWLKYQGEHPGGYLSFYPRFWNIRFSLSAFPVFFESPPPQRMFSVSHLWFLIVLFVYTSLLLPLFLYLRGEAGRHLVEGLASFFAHRWAIFLLALPIAVIEGVLTSEWWGVWNRFVWAFLLLYGFLFASEERFSRALVRHRKAALVLGIVCYLLYFAGMGMLIETAQVDPFADRGPGGMVVRFIKGVASWFCVVGIMGIATHWGQRRSREVEDALPAGEAQPASQSPADAAERRPTLAERVSAYAREAQLPFYVLHQTPIILIGYYVIQWDVNALVKFLVISLASLAITLIVYDIAVRRAAATRFLFGMRPRREP
jgi:glucan biosynthesis protein C